MATTASHWATLDAQRQRVAAHRTEANKRHGEASRQLADMAQAADAKPLPAHSLDRDIQAAADRRAATMGERIAGLSALLEPAEVVNLVNAWVIEAGARMFLPVAKWADRLRGMLARVQAPEWWRRQLRRDVVRRSEAEAIHAGRVNAKAGQWYASDDTVRRRLLQNKRNAAILESTELENDLGQVFTIKALAEKGTANKAIRRGELMTRIRGCEEWADAEGHTGLFLTLTAPSRFHQQLYHGGMNPNYRGETPRDAQAWLCSTWARARAQLARYRVKVYGFRVAEPHHDGCPHWHALLWVECERDRVILQSVLWAQWLADCGDEPGAADHRVKCERMRAGGASGYVAKYIAKNIDDAGAVAIEGHRDEWQGEAAELQGELWANPAQRVEAWAAAWGIRQFQAIGQPPVTIWRELRRVPADAAPLDAEGNGPARIALALDAVSRHEEQRACWATFLDMQGGTNTGRDYLIKMARQRLDVEGRYETVEQVKPLGVYEAGRPECVVHSVRREWKPRVSKGAGVCARDGVHPWTRVNNCTRGNVGELLAGLRERQQVPREGWAGGLHLEGIEHAPPESDRGRAGRPASEGLKGLRPPEPRPWAGTGLGILQLRGGHAARAAG